MNDAVGWQAAPGDLERRREAWMVEHPGYGPANFADAFRDSDGELVESEEFFDACAIFAPRRAHD